MNTVPDESSRPDGRAASTELVELRKATRALRLHLDELPIDFNEEFTGDRFLAGLAFMSTRQRYDCAESMIGAGFGGTVMGALARSTFVDGLRWLWIAHDPDTRRSVLLGDLLAERNRICKILRTSDSSCGNLPRWLMPLPNIADLTGESMSWFSSPTMPEEEALIDDYLTHAPVSPATAGGIWEVLTISGLRGAVAVLAHAGHGNYLGLQSSLTFDGAVGHDLRPDHEALFMHVAAAGVAATLVGTAAAVPELWPHDIEQELFLNKTLRLAVDVGDAARPLHKLATSKPMAGSPKPAGAKPTAGLLEPGAVLRGDDLLPDVNSVAAIARVAEDYYHLTQGFQIDVWGNGDPTLHQALMFGGAHSNLQTVMANYNRAGSEVITIFAARMLLEEVARHTWRYRGGNPTIFTERTTQYFDEYRAKQKKTISKLTSSGVRLEDARSLFALPANVEVPATPPIIQKSRRPLPSITEMLGQLGESFPEPGWLQVAYSLLSQVTHATPLGLMHSIRWTGATWAGNEISPEMLGLALDVACLSSATLIGKFAVVLTGGARATVEYHNALAESAMKVHHAGRMVHGLD